MSYSGLNSRSFSTASVRAENERIEAVKPGQGLRWALSGAVLISPSTTSAHPDPEECSVYIYSLSGNVYVYDYGNTTGTMQVIDGVTHDLGSIALDRRGLHGEQRQGQEQPQDQGRQSLAHESFDRPET